MSERKNIENLFQEKFQDFEVFPPEDAWGNIESKLKEKKQKRIIPFWWRVSGVAALLALGFSLLFINNNGSQNHSIVNQEINKNIDSLNNDLEINKKGIANSKTGLDNNSKEIQKENISLKSKEDQNYNYVPSKKIALSSSSSQIKTNNKNKKTNNYIAFDETKNYNNKDVSSPKTTILLTNSKDLKANNTSSKLVKNYDLELNSESNFVEKPIVELNESVLQNNLKVKNEISNPINIITDTKKDSTKMAVVELNSMEKLLNEKEKKPIAEQKLNRWQVMPNIAPIYFNSFSEGSPLDPNLIFNKKTYNSSLSYGVGINYSINKKLNFRTGISSISMDYNTNDIVFYKNSAASKMANLNPNDIGSTIQIDPLQNLQTSFNKFSGNKKDVGIINQKLGYIELPLEISYKLLNKKFGVELIGGLSTLLLNQNDVFLKNEDVNLKIGEANNLNKIHFSSNVGLGFKYNIVKHFDAKFEPVFKYQLNTFSSNSGDFKPYVFGVYSGICYSF